MLQPTSYVSPDKARTCVIYANKVGIYAMCDVCAYIYAFKTWMKLYEMLTITFQGVHFSFVSFLRKTLYTFAFCWILNACLKCQQRLENGVSIVTSVLPFRFGAYWFGLVHPSDCVAQQLKWKSARDRELARNTCQHVDVRTVLFWYPFIQDQCYSAMKQFYNRIWISRLKIYKMSALGN